MARPKGTKNKFNAFKDIAPWITDEQRQLLIDKAFELVEGVKCVKYLSGTNADGTPKDVVYDKPPDSYTIIQLLNHTFGSPTQKLKLGGDKENPLEFTISVQKFI